MEVLLNEDFKKEMWQLKNVDAASTSAAQCEVENSQLQEGEYEANGLFITEEHEGSQPSSSSNPSEEKYLQQSNRLIEYDNSNKIFIKDEARSEMLENMTIEEGTSNHIGLEAEDGGVDDSQFSSLSNQPTTLGLRGEMIGLKKAGWETSRIAKHLGIHRNTAMRWIRRYEKGLGLQSRPKSGVKRKTSKEQDEQIISFVREHPHTSTLEIIEKFSLTICPRTVRNRLKSAGVKHQPPDFLSEQKKIIGIWRQL